MHFLEAPTLYKSCATSWSCISTTGRAQNHRQQSREQFSRDISETCTETFTSKHIWIMNTPHITTMSMQPRRKIRTSEHWRSVQSPGEESRVRVKSIPRSPCRRLPSPARQRRQQRRHQMHTWSMPCWKTKSRYQLELPQHQVPPWPTEDLHHLLLPWSVIEIFNLVRRWSLKLLNPNQEQSHSSCSPTLLLALNSFNYFLSRLQIFVS